MRATKNTESKPKGISASRRKFIRDKAEEFLLLQNPIGEYALCFLDWHGLKTNGEVLCGSIEDFEESTGSALPTEVLGVEHAIGDGGHIVLIRDSLNNKENFIFTLLHEYGHAVLKHSENVSDRKTAEDEADLFALDFTIPLFIVKYLDFKKGSPLTVEEMKRYFPVAEKYLKKRRNEANSYSLIPNANETAILRTMFGQSLS